MYHIYNRSYMHLLKLIFKYQSIIGYLLLTEKYG